MSTYLQEYFKNTFKSKIYILVLSLILPVVIVFLPNNFWGMLLKMTMVVSLFALKGPKMPFKKQYRNIEKYLLPISDKELLALTYFENFVLLFPFVSVLVNGVFLFISVDEKIHTASWTNFIIIMLITLIVSLTGVEFRSTKELGVEFNEIDTMKRIRKIIRGFGSNLILISFITFFLVIDGSSKTGFPITFIFVYAVMIFYFIYVLINREKIIFNEHKIFRNLSFRPLIDIPTSIAVFLFFCLISLAFIVPENSDQRKPASVPNVHKTSSTQLRK